MSPQCYGYELKRHMNIFALQDELRTASKAGDLAALKKLADEGVPIAGMSFMVGQFVDALALSALHNELRVASHQSSPLLAPRRAPTANVQPHCTLPRAMGSRTVSSSSCRSQTLTWRLRTKCAAECPRSPLDAQL